jgi:hypothetical protein
MNTGKKPIENVEFVLEFVATGKFSLLNEEYGVMPGFGKVNISSPKKSKRLIKLELFNPGDDFIYSAIGTKPVKIISYTKFPGLSFYQEYSPGKRGGLYYTVIVLLAIFACYGLFIVFIVQKEIIKQYGIRNILNRGFINVYWNDRTKTEIVFLFMGFSIALLSCLTLVTILL